MNWKRILLLAVILLAVFEVNGAIVHEGTHMIQCWIDPAIEPKYHWNHVTWTAKTPEDFERFEARKPIHELQAYVAETISFVAISSVMIVKGKKAGWWL